VVIEIVSPSGSVANCAVVKVVKPSALLIVLVGLSTVGASFSTIVTFVKVSVVGVNI